ncbi:MAG: cell division protein ZapE [Gammaproteobacteria bacterium]|nr:cell division protein ZapE [Gammaproteobacteria bacterium]
MTTPATQYERLLRDREIAPDPSQGEAIAALESLHDALITAGPPPRGWRRRLSELGGRKLQPVKGIYLWGPVGRGKTFLMDLFFASLPFADKRRQHFHRFMNDVHAQLGALGDLADPLEAVAEQISAQTRIICFDEFAVSDIADAMILGNLFAGLFERGVTLVATSNVDPSDLYKEGLQRARFLPAIRLIEQNTELVHLGGPLDFRLRALERADVYQYPLGATAEEKLAAFFSAIGPDDGIADSEIEVLGRKLDVRREAEGIVWFDFEAICDGPRSQSDYIELARCYHTVLVSDVPQLTHLLENQARRFIALVDEFYDRKVKLVISAAVPSDELYAGKRLRFEFQRTRSRLEEMQSHDYLAASHLP